MVQAHANSPDGETQRDASPDALGVLLVEDDPLDQLIVRRCLRASARVPFEISVADLRLPQLSGLDLRERVKQDVRLRRVPFVMLSTSSHDFEVFWAYELGAAGYFVKPLAFEDYADIVERVVQFCLCAERPSAASGPREPEPRPGR